MGRLKKAINVFGVFLFCMLVMGQINALAITNGNWEYEIKYEYEETGKIAYASLTKYLGSDEKVIVPNEIDGYRVWELYQTFSWNDTITDVTIPSGIKYLCGTFSYCNKLINVNLPTSISDFESAFEGCKSLIEITIPKGEYAMYDAFAFCTSLKQVTINGKIINKGHRYELGTCNVFAGCSELETVNINSIEAPSSAYSAFYKCPELKTVNISVSIPFLDNLFNQCYSLKSLYLPKGVSKIDSSFENCYALADIYYAGSECEWKGIEKTTKNPEDDRLKQARIHFSEDSVHHFGDWAATKEPTITENGSQERFCSVCGEKETTSIQKLTPVLTVGKKSVKLAKTKSASLKVSFTIGDSVTVKSSNKKVVTATYKGGKITIKAQKKAGTANVIVKTKTGIKAVVKVTVPKVKTKKITCKAVSVKKGKKVTLKPKVTPAYSDDKVTFKSANKKIATVTAKGVVKGIKKGKTTITIKSGKKSVKVKVTVK